MRLTGDAEVAPNTNLMKPRRNPVRGSCVQTAALGAVGSQAVHQLNRRQLLASSAIALLLSSRVAQAALLKGALPWKPGGADPPAAVTPDGWHYFTPSEAATVEAFVDRLIPPDPQTPGGKDCGCAAFIDRQLAGPYGRNEAFHMMGPFQEGTKQQGPQIGADHRAAISQGAGRFRCRLPRQIQQQDFCRVVR